METLATVATSFAVFIVGLVVRFLLLTLVVVTIVSIPAAIVLTGSWLYELVRRRMSGIIAIDGLLWKRDLYYTPAHTWVGRAGEAVRVGLDDLAQRVLFDTRVVELPRPGTAVRAGEVVTRVTCGDKRAEIRSPVDGIVTAVNEAVSRDPRIIHQEPYVRGWLFAVAPVNSRYLRFLKGEAARVWFRREGHRLSLFLEQNLGVAAADGGQFIFPAPSLLGDQQWFALTSAFLGRHEEREDAVSAGSRAGKKGGTRRIPRALIPFVAIGGGVVGGVYVVLLPVIGLAMLVGFSGLRIWQGIRHGMSRLGAPMEHKPRRPGE